MADIAFLFGVSTFAKNKEGKSVDSIDFAKNNVSELKQLLSDRHILGAEIVSPENPSTNDMIESLTESRNSRASYENAILYICSHGKPVQGKLHIYGSETKLGFEDQLSKSFRDLRDLFLKIKARNYIIVLDACYSGLALTQAPHNFPQILADETRDAISTSAKASELDQSQKMGGFTICSSPPGDLSDKVLFEGEYTAFSGALIEAIKRGSSDKELEKLSLNKITAVATDILRTRHPLPYHSDLNEFGKVPLIGNIKFKASIDQSFIVLKEIKDSTDSIFRMVEEIVKKHNEPAKKDKADRSFFSSLFGGPTESPHSDIRKFLKRVEGGGRSIISFGRGGRPFYLARETERAINDDLDGRILAFGLVILALFSSIVEGSFSSFNSSVTAFSSDTPSLWRWYVITTKGFPVTWGVVAVFLYLLAFASLFSLRSRLDLLREWRTFGDGVFADQIDALRYDSRKFLERGRITFRQWLFDFKSLLYALIFAIVVSSGISSIWLPLRLSSANLYGVTLKIVTDPDTLSSQAKSVIGELGRYRWSNFDVSAPTEQSKLFVQDSRIVVSYNPSKLQDEALWIATKLHPMETSRTLVVLSPVIGKADPSTIEVKIPSQVF
ncbi:MAG: Serine/threonine protein kinase [Rhizobium sp.]|nr:Serine/threonine protein kinase [Rhizobium sp.]